VIYNVDRPTHLPTTHPLQAETDAAWRQWFVLPHLRDPTRDGQFSVFFSSSWADTLRGTWMDVGGWIVFVIIVIHGR
jgi:hypothetical protein